MDEFTWILIILCLMFVISMVVIFVFRFTTSKNVVTTTSLPLGDLFQQMPNVDNIELDELDLAKPFQLVTSAGDFRVNALGEFTLPPRYINGFLASVDPTQNYVLVQPGAASSSVTNQPMFLKTPVSALNQIGINGFDIVPFTVNSWYSIYIIAADDTSVYPTGCLLSLDPQNPTVMPTGYTHYRKIGTVRTTNVANAPFYAMQQQQPGSYRLTTLTGNQALRTEFVFATPDYVTLNPLVPNSAVDIQFGVRGDVQQTDRKDPATPVNAVMYFRNVGNTDNQAVKFGFPNAKSTFGEVFINLNQTPIPHQVQTRLFPMPGTGGSIPNSISPFIRFEVQCIVEAYGENV